MLLAAAWQALGLLGEFNQWKPKDHHWAFKNTFGVWELFLADSPDGKPAIPHRCVCVQGWGRAWGGACVCTCASKAMP